MSMRASLAPSALPPQEAWVVFSGETDLFWLRWLKPGFRHCFLLLNDGRRWITLDPLASHTEIHAHDLPATFDLPAWFRDQGYTAISAPIRKGFRSPAPPAFISCVEIVKRALGIRRILVLTPWQLYRCLESISRKPEGELSWEA